MANKLDICNAALMRLGAEPIAAFTDNSKRAKLCSAHYKRIKEEMLSEHPWNFAIKRESLSKSTISPAFEYANQFDLPSDYLTAHKMYPDTVEFKQENKVLLSNEDSLDMVYIASVAERLFSSFFTRALILRLAVEFSYTMVQSNELRSVLIEEMKDAERTARLRDAQEDTPHEMTADEWTSVRQ